MNKLLLLGFLVFANLLFSQKIKSPTDFLGYELGSQFTRHHEVVDYYEYLAKAASSNVKLTEYGKTNERRPLLLAYISSEENIKNLETIRSEHLKNTKGESNPKTAIVWLSYNVHGNESVSTEASMQTIYELLTNKTNYLKNTVIIIDPCINPDGRDRYVNWYNQYKNANYNIDPNSIEHHEDWWNGRSNHYMFDLNRDWAWLTQVESQQRIKQYNKWLPHIHVDFHEQGVDEPYYFAPASEPYHEVITKFQRDFQVTIGKNHAKYFDANGWFYFTKEVFDLLYPSYGDTYPMYNGSIGMTYEQGGSGRAGLGIVTTIGDTLTLKDRIAHHHTTGISTVEISSKNATILNTEFKKFFQNKNHKYKSYVLDGNDDNIGLLTQLLDQHEIAYSSAKNVTAKGFLYSSSKTGSLKTSENGIVISTNQPKSTLIKVLFEPKAKLSDSLTYDITAWSLPYAYGLNAVASTSTILGSEYNKSITKKTTLDTKAYSFITDWNSMNDARFLAELVNSSIKVRKARKPFSLDGKMHKRGSLIITNADNKNNKTFYKTLQNAAEKYGKILHPAYTGFVDKGKDFGSSHVDIVPPVKVAILSGNPTSTLQFGEVWHYFEQQLHYPLAVIDNSYFKNIELGLYDVLILPSGFNYKNWLDEKGLTKLKKWVNHGGKLIAMGGAIDALAKENGFAIQPKEKKKDTTANLKAFESSDRELIKSAITGAIFKTKVDNTHPLAYGYNDSYFTLKLGDRAYEYLQTGSVVYLEEKHSKPVSGFAGSNAQQKIKSSLIFGVENLGEGQVIYMVDNPLFRGFWESGKLFFANALFMVN